MPEVKEIMRKGFLWAAEGRELAKNVAIAENVRTYTGMGDSQ